MSEKGLVGGIAVAAALVVGAVGAFSCATRVPAGYVAVQYDMRGGIKEEVLTQGVHFTSPFISTTRYTVALEQSYLTKDKKGDSREDESYSASSKEGKELTIDLTFTYQYRAEDVVSVFNKFKGQDGVDIRDSFIKPNIISWSKEVIAKYKVADILGENRASVNKELTKYLSEKFKEYGITISNVSLINVDVDKETKKAISDKIKAQQEAETQAIKNQTAIDEAQAKVEVEKAKAEQQKIKAEAEAEANKKISNSLTQELVEYNKIQKWDGKVPVVTGGTSIVDVSGIN